MGKLVESRVLSREFNQEWALDRNPRPRISGVGWRGRLNYQGFWGLPASGATVHA